MDERLDDQHVAETSGDRSDGDQRADAMSAVPEIPAEIESRLAPVVEELLFRSGYDGLNIREIAKKVGMGPATIYKYYSSKERLALSVLQKQDQSVANFVRTAIPDQGRCREQWLAFYRALLLFYDANVKTAVVQNVSMPTYTWFLPEERWPVSATTNIIRGLIRQGRERGELDEAISDNQILATHYMHLVREVRLWRSRGMRWRLADRIDTFFPIIWKTISAPPRASEAAVAPPA